MKNLRGWREKVLLPPQKLYHILYGILECETLDNFPIIIFPSFTTSLHFLSLH